MPDRTHIRTACQTDAPSLGRGLAELAEQAAAGTPDSCGATATAVLAEESSGAEAADRTTAATHPDLSALVSVQMSAGEGPILAALDTGRPAGADDLLHDDRWPSYRARALDAGVRSTATLPFACDGLTVTVSVYGLRPGPLKKAAQGATERLGDLATESMARDRLYRAALVQVDQLDTALRTRPVVDQACGIVMYVLGCDADQAFDLLRRLSQRTNNKLAELAETVVRTRGRGLEKELIAFDRSAAPGPGRPASGPDRDLPG
ncbi:MULTISPECIES: ANTAR domain-containing response regulator [Streptomyces]|uniref:ANTAR domain-containing protein n=1 Tax=Streptomyces melanosporofaciens TaxID=67327 RepID=A0A1H4VJZ7_STRMJ|nr:GAF and ANTAR domain-containing protein [Streptomyces melanosporofaciens]SEC80674.1 ANTAR domain-containing protein [Streptomyces melanosporofaciens]